MLRFESIYYYIPFKGISRSRLKWWAILTHTATIMPLKSRLTECWPPNYFSAKPVNTEFW
jgi:hypothetical protein